jgi:glycosyltransferase involved in cell wall biosynthesis
MHDLTVPYIFPKAGPLRQSAVKILVRAADALVATNSTDLDQLARFEPPGRRYVIPIGSNVPVRPPAGFDRQAWRSRLGLQPGEVAIAYFGFLNHSKGIPTLLSALRSLLDAGHPARLVMIGAGVGDADETNREFRQKVLRQIGELKLAPHVVWTGHGALEEISGHLLASDVMALLFDDGESFRRTTLLAALTHGVPVVTTQRPGQKPELLQDGLNCCLILPGRPDLAAPALARLAGDPALRARLSAAGRELAAQFAWPQIVARTLAMYKEVAARA